MTTADKLAPALPERGVVDLPGLARELRLAQGRGRECPILNVLEVGSGAQALVSMGWSAGEGWYR